jgi:hypothetical protein
VDPVTGKVGRRTLRRPKLRPHPALCPVLPSQVHQEH